MKITILKLKRQEIGITQETLANQVRISIMTYYRYETGERIPDVIIAIRIARALNTTVEQLFVLPDNNLPS